MGVPGPQAPWADVDWHALPELMTSPTGGAAPAVLKGLMQAAMDSVGTPLAALCGGGSVAELCVLGICALRLSTLLSLLQFGRATKPDAAWAIEQDIGDVMEVFGPRYHAMSPRGGTVLSDEFGPDAHSQPYTLERVVLQLLGRFLYMTSNQPPPSGQQHSGGDEGGQFAFGENWKGFLERNRVSVDGMLDSVRELRRAVGAPLAGLRVLDLGCGSGLHSLAMRLLGASVTSADVQPASLEAARQLHARAGPVLEAGGRGGGGDWRFQEASALDARGLAALEPVDVVYSWGVLHHTGDVWRALHNAQLPLAEDGLLLVALYAEEFYEDKENIVRMKDFYRTTSAQQQMQLEMVTGVFWLHETLKSSQNPFEVVRNFSKMRGMDFWTDVRDWLGGWPMEFASASAVLAFARRSGLRCVGVRRYGGNTEFALTRPPGVARWTAGRVCAPLEGGWREDARGEFFRVQGTLFHWPQGAVSPRSWWVAELPRSMLEHSDGMKGPQRDRLLLVTEAGEPFGYPSAQWARPEATRDPGLSLFGTWEGEVYASPAELALGGGPLPPPLEALAGLRVCLLPDAELSPEEVATVRAQSAEMGFWEEEAPR